MKRLSEQQKKGGALALAGIIGIFTGTFLPPEVFSQILGIF
jgi:hypothetical protein